MANNRRQHDEKAWKTAKKVCRLNARQVEMARALGMNPNKLPALRPSPQQRWKLSVGEFIEERYRKLGRTTRDNDPHEPKPGWRRPSTPPEVAPAPALTKGFGAASPEAVRDRTWQTQDLTCYLMNLADALQQWLAQGTVAPEVLSQVGGELREIADALGAGAPISQVPGIPLPPIETPAVSPRVDSYADTFDDDIPF